MFRAAIDIGSNTVQMMAGEVISGRVRITRQYLAATRLGESEKKNHLSPKSIAATLRALKEIKVMLDRDGIKDISPVATSAVRDAENKNELLDQAKASLDLDIRVLSGQEEAYLSYLGASSLIPGEDALVLDIGGGSTELIGRGKEGLEADSIDLGAVRVYNNGWHKEKVAEVLEKVTFPPQDGRVLLAVGGTATTAVCLKKGVTTYRRQVVDGETLSLEDIGDLLALLEPLTSEERCRYSPLLADRGLVIVEGLWILQGIIRGMGYQKVTVSDAGILDGILLDRQKS